jgi:hypothetical protein
VCVCVPGYKCTCSNTHVTSHLRCLGAFIQSPPSSSYPSRTSSCLIPVLQTSRHLHGTSGAVPNPRVAMTKSPVWGLIHYGWMDRKALSINPRARARPTDLLLSCSPLPQPNAHVCVCACDQHVYLEKLRLLVKGTLKVQQGMHGSCFLGRLRPVGPGTGRRRPRKDCLYGKSDSSPTSFENPCANRRTASRLSSESSSTF